MEKAKIPCKRKIPHSPGCYLFKGKDGKVIYIGKAKDLKKRVSSYFSKTHGNPKTSALVKRIADIDFIVLDNEEEAILLESNLIKEHYPKYNIFLKDNSPTTYAVVTKEEFPRIIIARKNRLGEYRGPVGKLYGPFISSGRSLLIGPLRKAFRIRTCKKLPKKACLQFHLGFCDAPCEGKIGKKEYLKRIRQAEKLLSNRKNIGKYMEKLEGKMRKASGNMQYEKAMRIRDSIRALHGLAIRQKIDKFSEKDEDYIAVVAERGKANAQVWRRVRGVLRNRMKFAFGYVGENPVEEFLLEFYSKNPIPPKIYLNLNTVGMGALETHLARIRGGTVSLLKVPGRGQRAGLMRLIEKNIVSERIGGADPSLVLLQKELGLPRIPYAIECFDISNLQGKEIVGAMARLVNARPEKSQYRKFRIRSVAGQDDFGAMKEIVFRRYRRLRDEGTLMPDLIVVDGGIGQLNAALDAMEQLGISLPAIALAKKEEEIYGIRGKKLKLGKKNEALHILQRARDEAHRFAISYHRKLRSRKIRGKVH